MAITVTTVTQTYIDEMINSGARKVMLTVSTSDHQCYMTQDVHLLTNRLSEGDCATLKNKTPLFFSIAESFYFAIFLKEIIFTKFTKIIFHNLWVILEIIHP